MDKSFNWYSTLMYIYLYKGSSLIGKEIKIIKESKDMRMLEQLWNGDITFEATSASFIHFDKFFLAKVRALLVQDFPRIPTLLL